MTFTEAVYKAETIEQYEVKKPSERYRYQRHVMRLSLPKATLAFEETEITQAIAEEHYVQFDGFTTLEICPRLGRHKPTWQPGTGWWGYCEKCKLLVWLYAWNFSWVKDMKGEWGVRFT